MIKLRQVSRSDKAFLFEVYASECDKGMQSPTWSKQEQKSFLHKQFRRLLAYYAKTYPNAEYFLVLKNAIPVGNLFIERDHSNIHLIDMSILPEHRMQGISSYLMRGILREADINEGKVSINLMKKGALLGSLGNFGFEVIGNNGMMYELCRYPQPVPDQFRIAPASENVLNRFLRPLTSF